MMLPILKWGRSSAGKIGDDGYHSREERRRVQRLGALSHVPYQRIDGQTRQQMREGTPVAFRDVLIAIAREAGRR